MASESSERVSVRQLVEYSFFTEDILPLSLQTLDEGRRGHTAHQKRSTAQVETALSWSGEACGLRFVVSGRMDLYDPNAKPPLIEEIKLARGSAPADPLLSHLMQVKSYGHMLCERDGLEGVALKLSYVTPEGDPVASHGEIFSAEELRRDFLSLLEPYAAWRAQLQAHCLARDLSLAALRFPYDNFRVGQREMAAQAYTAILRRRKLFAVMPTGTGKSAAVLFPALKALGEGLTDQVFYLTARTTAQMAALSELERMREGGMKARVLNLSAKDKVCPTPGVACHPDICPRARGHYLRERAALLEEGGRETWDVKAVRQESDRRQLCPFEFSLALSEIADVVVCDYNYALDPKIFLRRIFHSPRRVTLLVDEAHNLEDRVRSMLSGSLSAASVAEVRRAEGRERGRQTEVYRTATGLIKALRELEKGLEAPREGLLHCAGALGEALAGSAAAEKRVALLRDLGSFLAAAERMATAPGQYRMLSGGSQAFPTLKLFCLNITEHLRERLKRMAGSVLFSATLRPLERMRDLLGGDSEDACFELPSPFPEENLRALVFPLNTRYRARDDTVFTLCEGIAAQYASRPGKYMAFFPSYAYLNLAAETLSRVFPSLPLYAQRREMDDEAREVFLRRFSREKRALLGLCVMGGSFAEGIDLPGLSLIGACVVGVSLPGVDQERELLFEHYERTLGRGFDLAYRYPGMHRVVQAAGRVIRSESDRGSLLLVDDRYLQAGYASLLPGHIRLGRAASAGDIASLLQEFWASALK